MSESIDLPRILDALQRQRPHRVLGKPIAIIGLGLPLSRPGQRRGQLLESAAGRRRCGKRHPSLAMGGAARRSPVRRACGSKPPPSRASTPPFSAWRVCSKRCSSGSACPTRSSVACGSTSAARCGRAGLPPGAGQPRGHGLAAAHHQRAQARHRRPCGGVPRGARAARAVDVRRRAAPLRGRLRSGHAVSGRGAGLPPADGRPAYSGRGRHRPGHRAGGGARAHRLPRRARRSADPQDETRLENLQELVAVAREFEEANREAARSPTSSSRSRWSPTPTRSRTPTSESAPGSSP